LPFIEKVGSLLFSQEPAISSYLESDKSIIILSCITKSST